MTTMASQITSLTVVYSTVYSDTDQRKHQSSASLAFVRRIHRGPVNSPHKWPVTRKMFPFDNVIMLLMWILGSQRCSQGMRGGRPWLMRLYVFYTLVFHLWSQYIHRANSKFAPSQWETALLCNDVSHWLGASLESALIHKWYWSDNRDVPLDLFANYDIKFVMKLQPTQITWPIITADHGDQGILFCRV